MKLTSLFALAVLGVALLMRSAGAHDLLWSNNKYNESASDGHIYWSNTLCDTKYESVADTLSPQFTLVADEVIYCGNDFGIYARNLTTMGGKRTLTKVPEFAEGQGCYITKYPSPEGDGVHSTIFSTASGGARDMQIDVYTWSGNKLSLDRRLDIVIEEYDTSLTAAELTTAGIHGIYAEEHAVIVHAKGKQGTEVYNRDFILYVDVSGDENATATVIKEFPVGYDIQALTTDTFETNVTYYSQYSDLYRMSYASTKQWKSEVVQSLTTATKSIVALASVDMVPDADETTTYLYLAHQVEHPSSSITALFDISDAAKNTEYAVKNFNSQTTYPFNHEITHLHVYNTQQSKQPDTCPVFLKANNPTGNDFPWVLTLILGGAVVLLVGLVAFKMGVCAKKEGEIDYGQLNDPSYYEPPADQAIDYHHNV